MKTKHLFLLGLVAAFSSCSTAYRTGQTPDDVYYSPAPAAQETYVTSNNQQDRNSYQSQNEEQEIRRGIQDPVYRSNLSLDLGYGYGYNPYSYNPYSYSYNPYSFNSYGYKGIYDPYGYNNFGYNNYYGYNNYGYNNFGYSSSPYIGNYYGGYYSPVYVYPGIGNINTNTGPRRVNLAAYNTSNNQVNRVATQGDVPARIFSQPRQGTGVGNVIRRVFTPSNNNYYTPSSSNNRTYSNDNNTRNTNSTPARTFDSAPSTNNSNSSSGSSGSAPVRTFRK